MIRRVKLRSLAKINLDLRVLNKRPDNFHELRTVFHTISLADEIEIEYQPARRTSFEIDDQLNIPDNLVLRAAKAALDAMKLNARVHFKLKKQIPMGGGLGGGSSNAAAVLLALPVLAGRVIAMDQLAELGASLGSDVPFFFDGGAAIGVGRGTETYGMADLITEPILVVSSGIHVSTGEAYGALGRQLTSPAVSPKINEFRLYVRALEEGRSARAANTLSTNDFESAVFGLHPTLKKIYGKLRKISTATRMTGSGSAIFAIFGSVLERETAQRSLEKDHVLGQCQLLPASLVGRAGYRRLWRKQLAEHLLAADDSQWPPRSRYAT